MSQKLKAHRGKVILFLILLLTAFLTLHKIWDAGNGNQYYTAAVKSMLTSWHNFFYVSFDPGGYISVDKPPLGLWLQCLFARIFGLHGWSVILPEALCSIGSVLVLYHIVKRCWGETTGLLAALIMALTPIFIAASRTNNLDPVLVLVCLLAMWALITAAEKGSPGRIILTMALLGIGFNVKMLQAYMFLPAVYIVYFFTAETTWRKRVCHLAAATAVLAAVSLSWCLAVDLTPAAGRPYVGSSSTNSTLELAIGYNGILRALPLPKETLESISGAISLVPNEGGSAGFLRLFNRQMAAQAGWLLPMAVFGLLALIMGRPRRQLLLWGGIFVPIAVYFSISGHIHRYYLIMFAPCLAALAAIAVTEFSRRFERGEDGRNKWENFLLPLSFAVTGAVQIYMLKAYAAGFSAVLVPLIIACVGLAVLMLAAVKLIKKDLRVLSAAAAGLAVFGLLAAPAWWAYTPVKYGANVIAPYAGPPEISKPDTGTDISQTTWGMKWSTGADLSGALISPDKVAYIMETDNGSRYQIAVPSIIFAVPLILNNGISAMPVGGYVGTDRSIGLDDFIKLVESGGLQYYLVMPMEKNEISDWVRWHGKYVDPAEYSTKPEMEFYMLYDLSGLRADES